MSRTCDWILREGSPQGPLSAELAEHARGCRDCTATLETFALLGGPGAPPPPPPLDPRLNPSGLGKARPWWVAAALAVLLLLATAFGAVLALGVRGAPGHPLMGGLTAASLLLLIAVGTWSALSPHGRRLRLITVGLAAVAALLIVAGATGEGGALPFWRAGLPCLATEVGATLPLLALLLWLLTRSSPGALKVVAAGLAGGAAGVFALHLHCPVSTVSHLVVFHLLPWAVLTGVALTVRRWMRTRSFAP